MRTPIEETAFRGKRSLFVSLSGQQGDQIGQKIFDISANFLMLGNLLSIWAPFSLKRL
jgi:hypothetical protein